MKIKFRGFAIALLTMGYAGVVHAIPLSDLITQNGSLTIGDKVFDHFGWATGDVLASEITISTIGNGTALNLYGIDINFNGHFTATGGPIPVDGDITYAVHTIGNWLISDIHSTVNVSGSEGFVLVSEVASDQQDQGTSTFVVPLVIAEGFSGAAQFSGVADLPPSQTVWINKDIMLAGDGEITDVEQRFSQVPDGASTLSLLGIALAGVEGLRRKHRK